jgi:putative transposase
VEKPLDACINFLQVSRACPKLIYTTNALEGLHRQLRKVTKNRTVFPTDEALTKILYLAIQDVMKKWTMPLANWALTISQLAVMYEGRFNLAAI